MNFKLLSLLTFSALSSVEATTWTSTTSCTSCSSCTSCKRAPKKKKAKKVKKQKAEETNKTSEPANTPIKNSKKSNKRKNVVEKIVKTVISVPTQIIEKAVQKAKTKQQNYSEEEIRGLRFNPNDTVIVWDLHDVLFELNKTKAINAISKSKRPGKLLRKLIGYKSNPDYRKNLCIEKYLESEDGTLMDGAIEAINAFEPIIQTTKLLDYLDKKGYTQLLCSNIGEKSLEYLKGLYPEVFNFFKDARICCKENGYLTKSNSKAFEEVAQKAENYLGFKPKHIVLIDDDKEKLDNAVEVDGFIGIKFVNPSTLEGLIHRKFL